MGSGCTAFEEVISNLETKTRTQLENTPVRIKAAAQEIRLISGYTPQVMANNKLYDAGSETVTKQNLEECLFLLCNGSIHTHQKELAAGFLSIKGGHRAGFASTAVYDNTGKLSSFRDITAIVIRIARKFEGISLPLIKRAFYDGPCGLVIAGAPSSGKTTVLRDLAYQLSKGVLEGCERIAVVDERGELGECGKSLVLKGYEKAEGMLNALRLLSPQVIMCDEIAEVKEAKAVIQAFNSGVFVITTVHAASKKELMDRPVSRELLKSGAFKRVAILTDKPAPCSIKEVFDYADIVKDYRDSFYNT